nr:N-acetylmuramidase domain-containing protein [Mangrovicoccus sp. HB161399]
MNFSCPDPNKAISEEAYQKAADELGCDIAAINTVAEVESSRAPFDQEGRPTILFERHKFRKFTGGRFSQSHPELSGKPGNYGTFSEQWPKMAEALKLDGEAALKSASWGQFQIMGFNHELAGYSDVEDFVEALAPMSTTISTPSLISSWPATWTRICARSTGESSRSATTARTTARTAMTGRWPPPTRNTRPSPPPRPSPRQRRPRTR